MDRPRFRAISAVTIATHDMRRAVRFYHALGLELASGGETAGAILVVFLIWLDVAWCIRLAGAAATDCHQHPATELARALHRGRAAARERLALRALAEVMHRYLGGAPPSRLGQLVGRLHAPADVLDELVRRGVLLRAAEPHGVALASLPERVALSEVLDAVRIRAADTASRPATPITSRRSSRAGRRRSARGSRA